MCVCVCVCAKKCGSNKYSEYSNSYTHTDISAINFRNYIICVIFGVIKMINRETN